MRSGGTWHGCTRSWHDGRFGFRLAAEYGITAPVDAWTPHFQVRTLTGYRPSIRGRFAYAEPFMA